MTPLGCVHRWGHGRPSRRPPDVLLTEDERLGLQRPPGWPTALLCLDCGVLWPGEPLPGSKKPLAARGARLPVGQGTGVS